MKEKSVNVFFLGLILFLGLACEKPTEPEFNNPYDQESENYELLPKLLTRDPSFVEAYSIKLGGSFTQKYGKQVIQKGVCWGLLSLIDIDNECTEEGEGSEAFSSTINGLFPDTTYYFRAYAINEDGIAYGEVKDTQTKDGIINSISTFSSEVLAKKAKIKYSFPDDEGVEIDSSGVCYNEFNNPKDEVCVNASTSNYIVELSGLLPDTEYSYKVFVATQEGIGYSESKYFTTMNGVPTFDELFAGKITPSSVEVSVIINGGGADITSSEICFASTQQSVINGNCFSGTLSNDTLIVARENLNENSRYYYAVFAENSLNSSSSEVKSFRAVYFEEGEGVEDIDGNFYPTVIIGGEYEWMTENLRTTRFSDGVQINQAQSTNEWNDTGSMAEFEWAYPEFDSTKNLKYGKLYNYTAAIQGSYEEGTSSFCPNGWRVTRNKDWKYIEELYGAWSGINSELVPPSIVHMMISKEFGEGNNLLGINILPAGRITEQGNAEGFSAKAFYYTQDRDGENRKEREYSRSNWGEGHPFENYIYVSFNNAKIDFGYSIRCVKPIRK